MKKYILLLVLLFSISFGLQVEAEDFKDINQLKERETIIYLNIK